MRLLSLREYRTERDVPLTSAEVHALQVVAGSISIVPSVRLDGCYDLTPGSYVGGIQLDTLSVEIRPKLPIERLLFLISYTLDPKQWRESDFNFSDRSSLFAAIIPGFVSQVRRAIHRGVLQGYRSEEDSLQTVRGRIRFDDQIRRRYGIAPPVEVRYDEFTEDITENRLIKAAIHTLGKMLIRSDDARRSLRAFDSALANVQTVEFHPRQLPSITYTRLNSHYRPAIELAKLILRSTTFEIEHGAVQTSAFLLDMNKVFEDFVYIALREALQLSPYAFPQGATGKRLCLDSKGTIRLEPDLSWWESGDCIFVGDVKYKNVNPSGVIHPDLYQLLAYSIAADLPGGLLIYAAGETDDIAHHTIHAGKTLQVVTLNLDGQPDNILHQIGTLARWIRGFRKPLSVPVFAAD